MGALVRLSFLPLLLLALTATRPAVLAAPVRMECGRWSWESCLDIGGGVRMLMLNENTGGGTAYHSSTVPYTKKYCTCNEVQMRCTG